MGVFNPMNKFKMLFACLWISISTFFGAEKNSFQGIEYFMEKPAEEGVFPTVVPKEQWSTSLSRIRSTSVEQP